MTNPHPDTAGEDGVVRWITVECERALYVDRGRTAVLCDRLPSPVTMVLKVDQANRYGWVCLDTLCPSCG